MASFPLHGYCPSWGDRGGGRWRAVRDGSGVPGAVLSVHLVQHRQFPNRADAYSGPTRVRRTSCGGACSRPFREGFWGAGVPAGEPALVFSRGLISARRFPRRAGPLPGGRNPWCAQCRKAWMICTAVARRPLPLGVATPSGRSLGRVAGRRPFRAGQAPGDRPVRPRRQAAGSRGRRASAGRRGPVPRASPRGSAPGRRAPRGALRSRGRGGAGRRRWRSRAS